jgi:predicted AlkP superfamily phosphohydrolase/phosphomutase/Flp pilus assembly protein TadD
MRARARRGGAAAALVALFASSCGREAPATAPASSTPAAAAAAAPAESPDVATRQKRPAGARSPVIWLGFDAFDFELVDRLAAQGRMPNWKRLTAEGYTATLKSYMPILSPIVWTTLATGVGPDIHRVLDFQEVDPRTGAKVPISGNSRALPAIWNVASASGLTVGVVGWWATHPAEEVRGFLISDHASPILFEGLPRQGVAFPAGLAAGVDQVSAREGPVSNEELARYVAIPAAEIEVERAADKGGPNNLVLLARAIGATRVESRIARELYDRHLPDLMMLYLEGTDVVGHLFASEVPPQMSCVSDADFARYRGTVDEYYALVDRQLGQWMRRAEEDGATLIVNSDHGFKWGRDRSCERGSLDPATAGFWHRLDGVFAAWGARVKKSPQRGHASVFDVEPTVAALLGLPVDRRATGSPIRAAFGDLPTPPRKDLAAEVPVRRLAAEQLSAKESSEYAKQLMALGYLSGAEAGKLAASGGDRPGLTEGAWNNLGLYLSSLGGAANLAAAETAYRKALELWPAYTSPRFNLAVLERIRGHDRSAIDGLFEALAAGHKSPERSLLEWALYYNLKGKAAEEREVLERGARAYPDSEDVQRALALSAFQSRDCRRADAALSRFEAATQEPQTLNALALIRVCLGRRDEAVALFRRSLAIAPQQKEAAQSLALLQSAAPSGR